MKTCMVTGHRDINPSKTENIKAALRKEIMLAIADGYRHFISGFAEGADLFFAEIVSELKAEYSLTLEAAIPYQGRMNAKDSDFQRLLPSCDNIIVHSDKYYKACFMKRNRYMVEQSDRIIAIFDGRTTGGTAATINYAYSLQKNVKIIN